MGAKGVAGCIGACAETARRTESSRSGAGGRGAGSQAGTQRQRAGTRLRHDVALVTPTLYEMQTAPTYRSAHSIGGGRTRTPGGTGSLPDGGGRRLRGPSAGRVVTKVSADFSRSLF